MISKNLSGIALTGSVCIHEERLTRYIQKEKCEMKEAVITHSPHAFAPKKELTQEEREDLYRTRLDESFKPYTVIDVLTKVYHRNFAEDLLAYVGAHSGQFCAPSEGWSVSRVWINEFRIIRPESVFFQSTEDFRVDIYADARIKLEAVRSGNDQLKKRYSVARKVRLRYSFDLIPCHLDCWFIGVITDDAKSLQATDEFGISADKYFLPVLKGNDDYLKMSVYLLMRYRCKSLDADIAFDPMGWLEAMHLKRKVGVFPENGVQGEYFFSFGTADTVDPETGEIHRSEEMNPGTVLISREVLGKGAAENTTATHEGCHYYLDHFFFALQMTHGHQYCSYMCKRFSGNRESHEKWSPIDIMEMQANKLPGYLMIQTKTGKERARKLLASYGGERSLVNMRRLVNDMAEYYATTKTVARTRLLDFGYNEVRGLQQSANGGLIPSYISELSDDETYTIDEADGVREYIRNPEFRKIMDAGAFVYVEGHYCLNKKEYVVEDQFGFRHLTMYAREHMDECCLAFRKTYQNAVTRFINGILQKGFGKGRRAIQYQKKDGTSAVTEEGERLLAQIKSEMAERFLVRKSFNDLTCDLMDRRKMTKGRLAEATGLSPETIQNMRNAPDIAFSVQEIVAVAIALHLPREVSEEYIQRSPGKFLDTEDMYCYQYALNNWYTLPVAVVNRKLVDMGILPLTRLVQGYDDNGVEINDASNLTVASV